MQKKPVYIVLYSALRESKKKLFSTQRVKTNLKCWIESHS